jgi:hypothetical protein
MLVLLESIRLWPELLHFSNDSYEVTMNAQFGWARTSFLFLGGGTIHHYQDRSPNTTLNKHNYCPILWDLLCSTYLLLLEVWPTRVAIIYAGGVPILDVAVL